MDPFSYNRSSNLYFISRAREIEIVGQCRETIWSIFKKGDMAWFYMIDVNVFEDRP